MTGHGSGLATNTLHHTSVTEETVCVVGDQVVTGLVENSGGVCLSNGKTNGVGDTLTERTCCHLDTGGVVNFGVTRSLAVEGSESLQVVHAQVVAEKVEESILKHATVTVGENETIPVDPVWVLRVEGHELVEHDMGDWGHTHGRARVARVGGCCGIDLET